MGGGGSRKRKSYVREVPHASYTATSTKVSSGGIALFDDCESIKFLAAIVLATAATTTLVIGEELLVSLDAANNVRLFNAAGNHCGNIIGKQAEKIVECIRKGYEYKAIVKTIAPNYTVRVQIK